MKKANRFNCQGSLAAKLFTGVDPSWQDFLNAESQKPYFVKLLAGVEQVYYEEICFPAREDIWRIFRVLKANDVKVVILGQDPYQSHSQQADGIAFSLKNNNIKLPPSLRNIFLELQADLNINHFGNGSLLGWVQQGVLLVNTVWTVTAQQPNSHFNMGWQKFTNNLLEYIHINNKAIFVLWGNQAQKTAEKAGINLADAITAGHPSPLSYRFFRDKKIFSRVNLWLEEHNLAGIDWSK